MSQVPDYGLIRGVPPQDKSLFDPMASSNVQDEEKLGSLAKKIKLNSQKVPVIDPLLFFMSSLNNKTIWNMNYQSLKKSSTNIGKLNLKDLYRGIELKPTKYTLSLLEAPVMQGMHETCFLISPLFVLLLGSTYFKEGGNFWSQQKNIDILRNTNLYPDLLLILQRIHSELIPEDKLNENKAHVGGYDDIMCVQLLKYFFAIKNDMIIGYSGLVSDQKISPKFYQSNDKNLNKVLWCLETFRFGFTSFLPIKDYMKKENHSIINEEGEEIKNANEEGEEIKNANEEGEEIKNANEEGEEIKNANEEGEEIKNANEEGEEIKNANDDENTPSQQVHHGIVCCFLEDNLIKDLKGVPDEVQKNPKDYLLIKNWNKDLRIWYCKVGSNLANTLLKKIYFIPWWLYLGEEKSLESFFKNLTSVMEAVRKYANLKRLGSKLGNATETVGGLLPSAPFDDTPDSDVYEIDE